MVVESGELEEEDSEVARLFTFEVGKRVLRSLWSLYLSMYCTRCTVLHCTQVGRKAGTQRHRDTPAVNAKMMSLSLFSVLQ